MSESRLAARTIQINGIKTPVLEGGPQTADEAVIFVHGNPGSGRDWAALAAETSTFARVVAPDMPGFGRADKPADFDYTIEGFAAHLEAVRTALGIRRVHLVLHDFGGPWGLAWAATHTEDFASCTLVNTGHFPGYRWHYLARIWRTPLIGELFQATVTRSAFHLLLKHGNRRSLSRAFVDRMYDDFDSGTRSAVLKLYRATSDISGLSAALAEVLKPLQRPGLIVWGRRDPYIEVRFAERQRDIFPEAEVHILDDSGHWPFADNPVAVQAAVLPFLRRQLTRRAS